MDYGVKEMLRNGIKDGPLMINHLAERFSKEGFV
jgi:hypothetical protein